MMDLAVQLAWHDHKLQLQQNLSKRYLLKMNELIIFGMVYGGRSKQLFIQFDVNR